MTTLSFQPSGIQFEWLGVLAARRQAKQNLNDVSLLLLPASQETMKHMSEPVIPELSSYQPMQEKDYIVPDSSSNLHN
jgi:hypothetical protein